MATDLKVEQAQKYHLHHRSEKHYSRTRKTEDLTVSQSCTRRRCPRNCQPLGCWFVHTHNLQEFVLTINIEGDDVFYGQALFPVPAEDPNDPLQVCFHTTSRSI
jgi:hypothetical protein